VIGDRGLGSVLPDARDAPVAVFARAVKDTSPVYRSERAAREAGFERVPVPPTFTFVMADSGAYPDLQPADGTGSMYAASLFSRITTARKAASSRRIPTRHWPFIGCNSNVRCG